MIALLYHGPMDGIEMALDIKPPWPTSIPVTIADNFGKITKINYLITSREFVPTDPPTIEYQYEYPNESSPELYDSIQPTDP